MLLASRIRNHHSMTQVVSLVERLTQITFSSVSSTAFRSDADNLGEAFELEHYSGVSSAASRMKLRIANHRSLKRKVEGTEGNPP